MYTTEYMKGCGWVILTTYGEICKSRQTDKVIVFTSEKKAKLACEELNEVSEGGVIRYLE